MGLLTMLIGPRGGGKTTEAVWVVQDCNERYPGVPIVSNLPIENAIYVPNILKFLATKLIVEGKNKNYEVRPDGRIHILKEGEPKTFMIIIVDEAAISGFEARGSGLFSLNSYLIALSRKLHVDIWLVSQLMSMVEKRGQWLADFYWLCASVHYIDETGAERVLYFEYKIFDENFDPTERYKIWGYKAEQYLFPMFESDDIPNYEDLAAAYRTQFNITEDDLKLYDDIAHNRPHMEPPEIQRPLIVWYSPRRFQGPRGRFAGSKVRINDRLFEVVEAVWDDEEHSYRYQLQEVEDPVPLEERVIHVAAE